MGNDARIPPQFVGNRLHSFFKFRKSSAPNFSGSLSFQIGAVFSSSVPEDIRWQAAQSRSRQSLVRAHTDSPRREPECQSSEPGSTPPAAVWYRVRAGDPRRALGPGRSRERTRLIPRDLGLPRNARVRTSCPLFFCSRGEPVGGGPCFRPSGTQSLCCVQGVYVPAHVYGGLGQKTSIQPAQRRETVPRWASREICAASASDGRAGRMSVVVADSP